MWYSKQDVLNMKCLKNIILTWIVLEMWHSYLEITLLEMWHSKYENVSEMWCLKDEMFQKCDVSNMKYLRNATF